MCMGEYVHACVCVCVCVCVWLQFPDLGILEMPNLPDTSLYTKESNAYAAGGLRLEPVVPMKKWKLFYDGKMRYSV